MADPQRAGLKKWYDNHFGEEPSTPDSLADYYIHDVVTAVATITSSA